MKPKQKKKQPTPCESCVWFDTIDEAGTLGCTVDVDEDEAYRERAEGTRQCPYYQYYDEYKLVRKQN